ncbi:MAG: hypothetical protein KF724_11055 [Phycisphaeraceae bacterium]|nr:hypothetical protein [Phycisphaeraceae bacterium]
MPLRAAQPLERSAWSSIEHVLPHTVTVPEPGWLCKFKGTPAPAPMMSDLVFSAYDDASPFRERVVRW